MEKAPEGQSMRFLKQSAHYSSPYSPDFHPIERAIADALECFSPPSAKTTSKLRLRDKDLRNALVGEFLVQPRAYLCLRNQSPSAATIIFYRVAGDWFLCR